MAAPLGQVLTRLGAQAGPRLLATAKTLGPVLAANPAARERASSLVDAMVRGRKARTKPERLRRTVEHLRAEALRQQAAARGPDAKDRTAEWIGQLDALSGAAALLSVRQGAARRDAVQQLERRIDELFAQILTAAVEGSAGAPGSAPRDQT